MRTQARARSMPTRPSLYELDAFCQAADSDEKFGYSLYEPSAVTLRPATAALDGERAFSLPPDAEFSVRLSADGPRVGDARAALSGG